MAGVGVPQGLQGIFGQTVGASGSSGGTVQAIKQPSGALAEYNPATMTPDAPKAPPVYQAGESLGMGMNGQPDYITNWLAQGAKGTMPTSSFGSGPVGDVEATPVAADSWATPAKKPTYKIGTGAMTGSGGYGGGPVPDPGGATAPKPAAAAAAAPSYTQIPFNAPGGYNQPGLQQPMAVSDQYNPWTGSSQQIASPGKGVSNAPQVMGGPIFVDGKGGYFGKDPSGKIVPLTGTALSAAQGIGRSMGYA
jgi:hypothetical protein